MFAGGKKWYIITSEWEKVGSDNKGLLSLKKVFITYNKNWLSDKSNTYVYRGIYTFN